MKAKIIAWIQSPRNFYEGAAIYNIYGHNLILKKRFANKNETTEALLLTELCKLAGISEEQAKRYPRFAKSCTITDNKPAVEYVDDTLLALMDKLGLKTADLEGEDIPGSISGADEKVQAAYTGAKQVYIAIPETTRRVIKIREEFPFLKADDCPVEIKILVHDMFSEYDKYRDAYLKLTAAPEDVKNEELFSLAQTTIESYLSNREMWEELEYYKKHNTILGNHPALQRYAIETELKALSDIDLNQRLLNARSNLTKAKNKIKDANGDEKKLKAGNDGVVKWDPILKLIETELAARKK